MKRIMSKIPHRHWWRVSRANGITQCPNEKECRLCGKRIHLKFSQWLKDNPVWVDGSYEEGK